MGLPLCGRLDRPPYDLRRRPGPRSRRMPSAGAGVGAPSFASRFADPPRRRWERREARPCEEEAGRAGTVRRRPLEAEPRFPPPVDTAAGGTPVTFLIEKPARGTAGVWTPGHATHLRGLHPRASG